jgi:hypothetical protein
MHTKLCINNCLTFKSYNVKKYIIIIICLFSTVKYSFSQEFSKDLQEIKKVKILELYGNLEIEGVLPMKIQIVKESQKELPIDVDMAKPEYFKNDNTKTGLCFEYYDGVVIISPTNQEAQFTNYNFKIPKSAQLEVKTEYLDEKIEITDTKNTEIFNTLKVRNIQAEINIEVFHCDLYLYEVSGPLTLATFTGNQYIDFSKLNQINPTSIELFAGNIDIVLPKSASFDVNLGVKIGNIYSEFYIDIIELTKLESGIVFDGRLSDTTENTGKKYDASKVIGLVNKGGVNLSVHTFVGNVNLKKK